MSSTNLYGAIESLIDRFELQRLLDLLALYVRHRASAVMSRAKTASWSKAVEILEKEQEGSRRIWIQLSAQRADRLSDNHRRTSRGYRGYSQCKGSKRCCYSLSDAFPELYCGVTRSHKSLSCSRPMKINLDNEHFS